MRLTLRTLLAYLDDTLEPAQAKLIGQKVAESDTARELIERIKQVTRRRRLTAPPAAGPGAKIDPNTIAEYLDNVVSPEQSAEVEQICLASDVHLAEVAACHQILTLVLGEPALVPPTANERMYALVQGAESITRRSPRPAVQEPELEESKDTDEALRLGLPPMRRQAPAAQRLLVLGGSMVVACVLIVAIWQVLRGGRPQGAGNGGLALNTRNVDEGKTGDQKDEPLIDKKDGNGKKDANGKKDGNGKGAEAADKKDEETKSDAKKGEELKGADKKGDDKKGDDGKPPVKIADKTPAEVPPAPPSTKQVVVGNFIPPATKAAAILLQPLADKTDWRRLDSKRSEVYSGRPLVSLPGCRSTVDLQSEVRLTLWGNVPELLPAPLFESRVEIHHHDRLDLDMTLQRGRVVLTNLRKERAALVRLRVDNPTQPDQPLEHMDLTLAHFGSSVLIDRWAAYPRNEPFFPNPKDANRVGPTAQLLLVVMSGSASMKSGDVTFNLSAPPGPALLLWNSHKGMNGPHILKEIPEFTSETPPLPKEMDIKLRVESLRARDELLSNLIGRGKEVAVEVALVEAVKGPDAGLRKLAVRCFGALDDLPALLEALDQEKHQETRMTAIETLRQWIALSRDNDYQLYDALKRKYKTSEAGIIMTLLHSISEREVATPETYESLIAYLDNPHLLIRELGAWHLYLLVPAGRGIRYSAAADAGVRRQAQQEWRNLIPPGQLPPQPKKL